MNLFNVRVGLGNTPYVWQLPKQRFDCSLVSASLLAVAFANTHLLAFEASKYLIFGMASFARRSGWNERETRLNLPALLERWQCTIFRNFWEGDSFYINESYCHIVYYHTSIFYIKWWWVLALSKWRYRAQWQASQTCNWQLLWVSPKTKSAAPEIGNAVEDAHSEHQLLLITAPSGSNTKKCHVMFVLCRVGCRCLW